MGMLDVTRIRLERPHVRYKDSYLAAFSEMSSLQDQFAWIYLGECEPLDTPRKDFQAYVDKLNSTEHIALPTFVRNITYWAIYEGEVIGRIGLRLELNDFLKRIGGHIGYIVRPSYRRMGVATEMLRQLLTLKPTKKIGKLLITCDEGNIASEKTILRNGGVFEDMIPYGHGPRKKRFWITLNKEK